MSKKTSKAVPTMAKETAMIVAVISFLMVFFVGVGFAVYKVNPDPVAMFNNDQRLDQVVVHYKEGHD